MTRHSKNNTAGAFFTSAERSRLDYGTQSQRLGRESFRKANACYVCLQTANDPVCCPEGHLFCRECILNFIITQRTQLQQQIDDYERRQRQKQAEERNKSEIEQRKQLELFEQQAINTKKAKKTEKIEKAGMLPSTAGSFWLPGSTPTSNATHAVPPKKEVSCPAGKHPITSKRLVTVRWSMEGDECICRVCGKGIAKVTRLVLLKGCGHVCCQRCHEELCKDQDGGINCPQCNTAIGADDVLPMAFDGTSFAGSGGQVEVKRHEPALI